MNLLGDDDLFPFLENAVVVAEVLDVGIAMEQRMFRHGVELVAQDEVVPEPLEVAPDCPPPCLRFGFCGFARLWRFPFGDAKPVGDVVAQLEPPFVLDNETETWFSAQFDRADAAVMQIRRYRQLIR